MEINDFIFPKNNSFFPNNPNLTFEKIIMAYNMRCKDNNNNNPGGTSRVGCGAYDYSCHTYVHDSTKVDSVLNFTTDHIISNFLVIHITSHTHSL